MKINVRAAILDLDGNPIKDDVGKSATVGFVLVTACLAPQPQGKTLTPEESIDRYAIATAAHRDAEIELSAAQAVMLKPEVARCFGPLVAGQVLPLLDGK